MSLHIKEWQWKMHGYVKGLNGCHVKAPYMTPRDYMRALLNAQRTVQAFRELLAENSKATTMLMQKQIATERERERAQRQIGEAMSASDGNYEAYKNAKVADLSVQIANAERERDNARAALAECQKLNAMLTEKLRSHQRMAASGVYVKTAEYAAECGERRDLRRKLEEMTKDRDAQRVAWNAAESEMWLGELREQLTAMTAERDRGLEIMNEMYNAGRADEAQAQEWRGAIESFVNYEKGITK